MTDRKAMQADGGGKAAAGDGVGKTEGDGQSAGGSYPHDRKGKPFDGGQSEQGYEGPDNPNATTRPSDS